MLCTILTNEADYCSDGQIASVQLRRHAAFRLDLQCDVLIGRDAVGLSQLQHRGYSWVVGAHTHHPAAVVQSLTAAGRKHVSYSLTEGTMI